MGLTGHSFSRIALSLIYLLYIAGGLYSFVNGGFTPVRGVFFTLGIVTLVAVAGYGARWARVTGMAFGGVLALLGGAAVAFALLGVLNRDDPQTLPILGASVVLMATGVWTFVFLREPQAKSGERPGEQAPKQD